MERLLLLKLFCDTVIILFGIVAISDILYRLKQNASKKYKTCNADNKEEVRAHFINVEDLKD